jgi:hypothetical protein
LGPHILQLRDPSEVTTAFRYGTQNYASKVQTQKITKKGVRPLNPYFTDER